MTKTAKIQELLRQGKTTKQIQKQLKVSFQLVSYAAKVLKGKAAPKPAKLGPPERAGRRLKPRCVGCGAREERWRPEKVGVLGKAPICQSCGASESHWEPHLLALPKEVLIAGEKAIKTASAPVPPMPPRPRGRPPKVFPGDTPPSPPVESGVKNPVAADGTGYFRQWKAPAEDAVFGGNPQSELLNEARSGDEHAVWRATELFGSSWRLKAKSSVAA